MENIIIIPLYKWDKTECGKIMSNEKCQFGINWNNYKKELFKNDETGY